MLAGRLLFAVAATALIARAVNGASDDLFFRMMFRTAPLERARAS